MKLLTIVRIYGGHREDDEYIFARFVVSKMEYSRQYLKEIIESIGNSLVFFGRGV
jgi:hypothetical protein